MNYMETVERFNKEKDVQQAELNVAARIQKEMLPKETSDNEMINIRTYMKSAKTVGGDFYNYVDLDNQKYEEIRSKVIEGEDS